MARHHLGRDLHRLAILAGLTFIVAALCGCGTTTAERVDYYRQAAAAVEQGVAELRADIETAEQLLADSEAVAREYERAGEPEKAEAVRASAAAVQEFLDAQRPRLEALNAKAAALRAEAERLADQADAGISDELEFIGRGAGDVGEAVGGLAGLILSGAGVVAVAIARRLRKRDEGQLAEVVNGVDLVLDGLPGPARATAKARLALTQSPATQGRVKKIKAEQGTVPEAEDIEPPPTDREPQDVLPADSERRPG